MTASRTPEARGRYNGPKGRGLAVHAEDISGTREHVRQRMCERLRGAVGAAEPGDEIKVTIRLNKDYQPREGRSTGEEGPVRVG